MRKHRGLRRYYKNLSIKNEFDNPTWFDFNPDEPRLSNWHQHFDWYGYGNTNFKKRKPHLDKLFRHFEILEEKTKVLDIDFQLFVMLFDYNSRIDSLYLHTSNANGMKFPMELPNPAKDSTLRNTSLNEYITALTDYEKLFFEGEGPYCVIFKKGVGMVLGG